MKQLERQFEAEFKTALEEYYQKLVDPDKQQLKVVDKNKPRSSGDDQRSVDNDSNASTDTDDTSMSDDTSVSDDTFVSDDKFITLKHLNDINLNMERFVQLGMVALDELRKFPKHSKQVRCI